MNIDLVKRFFRWVIQSHLDIWICECLDCEQQRIVDKSLAGQELDILLKQSSQLFDLVFSEVDQGIVVVLVQL